jgi:hypothetical protein
MGLDRGHGSHGGDPPGGGVETKTWIGSFLKIVSSSMQEKCSFSK